MMRRLLNKIEKTDNHSVDPSNYDMDYFLEECEGYQEYISTKGQILTKRLVVPIKLANPKRGMRILDIGCGRGELLAHFSQQEIEIWGIDFAQHAINLSQQLLDDANQETNPFAFLIRSNAKELPFPDCMFDIIFMLDIVEHLNPSELQLALSEAYRLLHSEAKLIIHTAPNLWYYKYGFPFYRLYEKIFGKDLPKDPKERFTYHKHVHINEQSPHSLAKSLKSAGFKRKVWTDDFHRIWAKRGKISLIGGWLVTHIPLIKNVFCGDIVAIGQKGEEVE